MEDTCLHFHVHFNSASYLFLWTITLVSETRAQICLTLCCNHVSDYFNRPVNIANRHRVSGFWILFSYIRYQIIFVSKLIVHYLKGWLYAFPINISLKNLNLILHHIIFILFGFDFIIIKKYIFYNQIYIGNEITKFNKILLTTSQYRQKSTLD